MGDKEQNNSSAESRGPFYLLLSAFAILVGWSLHARNDGARKPVTENELPAVPKSFTAIDNAAPSRPSSTTPENSRYPKTPWWKTTAEMLGIVAVVVYAIVSYFQWDTGQRQLEATE